MARVHHLVLLKLKPGTKGETFTELVRALDGLRTKLPGIESLMGGPYASPEGLNKGFTHGLVIAFQDAQTRNTYLGHPDHERIKNQFLPYCEDVIAFDFEEPSPPR
jgi:hypothetical protein